MININFLVIPLSALLICGCGNESSVNTAQSSTHQDEVTAEPSEFEKKLIQRSEMHERDADKIRDRINLSSEAQDGKTSDPAEPTKP